MSKIFIYRLSVVLEEKVDYYAHQGKTARHEPARRWELLNIKDPDKYTPLLPILSESVDAASRSPLARHVDEEDLSAAAGQLLNPTGPWSFRFSLKVPDCTTKLHFTNKYTKAKIVVTHHVKIIMRVDRGDDTELDAKGKRKQFDIIVEAPIQLLSPTYSLFPLEANENSFACVCNSKRSGSRTPQLDHIHNDLEYATPMLGFGAMPARPSSSHAPRSLSARPPIDSAVQQPRGADSLDDRSRQYAALVSGGEREDGERPPSYESTVA
ncbi:hypothetical protein FRB90_009307 [Tulasnella sp. 427]|nr:hypothetical protein FRB90_009307 [Tulasnella sp. 427]